MSRRSSGGGDGTAVDEGRSFGPEVFFSRGGVSTILLGWSMEKL